MGVDLRRAKKELEGCNKDPETSGIKAELVTENDYLHLKGTIQGPIQTPYEGGVFDIDITLPSDYPFEPPKMRFITKCWHPNISSDSGAICLDILKTEWSPALTIRTALISLQALLSAAEPDDPQDAIVAKQYKEHHDEFLQTAKFWTEVYAAPPEPDAGPRAAGVHEMIAGASKYSSAISAHISAQSSASAGRHAEHRGAATAANCASSAVSWVLHALQYPWARESSTRTPSRTEPPVVV